jgi:hypothetical protein
VLSAYSAPQRAPEKASVVVYIYIVVVVVSSMPCPIKLQKLRMQNTAPAGAIDTRQVIIINEPEARGSWHIL